MRTLTLKAAARIALVAAGAALASPPAQNGLGAHFRIVSTGTSSVVEIRLQPKAAFDSVRVEAASGVATLTPPCEFAGVSAGARYSCRVNLSARQGAAAMTLNLVGERTVDPDRPRVVEVSHFTLATGSAPVAPAVRSADKSVTRPASQALQTPEQPASGLIFTPAGGTPK